MPYFYRSLLTWHLRRPFDERAHKLQGFGFNLHQCSFLGGLPELVVPIGQVPVVSKTTGRDTFEPVCVGLIGPPGMFKSAKYLHLLHGIDNILQVVSLT